MTDMHILLNPITNVWKWPKFFFNLFLLLLTFLTKVEGLIGYTRTQIKNLKFGMVVYWTKYFFVDTHNFVLNSNKIFTS